MSLQPLVLNILRLCVWLIVLMAVFVPLERRYSRRAQKTFRHGFGVDLGYYFLNSLLPKVLLALPLSMIAIGLHRFAPGEPYSWIAAQPFWLRFVVALLVGEVGAYWGHRLAHEIPVLWRFHSIHHSAEEMDWLVNTRAHPLDITFTRLCGLIPIYVFGLAQPVASAVDMVPLLYVLFGTVWSFLIHANVRCRFGLLEGIVSTPAFHHWHHAQDGPESSNKNYAAIFPWIDKIFGTLYLPTKHWPLKYGIDTPTARSLVGQLLQPFDRH